MNEFMYLQQVLTTAGSGWLSVGVLFALIYLALRESERLRSTVLFRWSGICLALSVFMPSMVQTLILALGFEFGRSARFNRLPGDGYQLLIQMLPSLVGPFLLGLSILMLLASIRLRGGPAEQPQVTSKHPLD